jgi:integrase
MRKEVMEVVEKYKDLPDGRLFPYMDRQAYNECLRELILKANIMRKVPILNKITMTKELKYLWEVFSSHNVRKSFIAACKRKGIQNSTIASMSGHQPNSKAFNRYYTVMDEEKVEALDMI